MSQITLYLDDELEAKLKTAASSANLSKSRYVANLIAEKLNNEWPAEVVASFGTWSEFPDAETLRQPLGVDIPREPFE